jgi:hypothetical protein
MYVKFQVSFEGISKSFRTESLTKYTLSFGITRCGASTASYTMGIEGSFFEGKEAGE